MGITSKTIGSIHRKVNSQLLFSPAIWASGNA
jgi:hypothetical protein